MIKILLIAVFMLACGKPIAPDWGQFPTHWHTPGEPVYLSWKHSPGSDVKGYRLYFGCKGCPKYRRGNDGTMEKIKTLCRDNTWYGSRALGYRTSYAYPVDAKVCRTYQFRLTAYNIDGTESNKGRTKYYCTDVLDPDLNPPGKPVFTAWDRWDGTEYSSDEPLSMEWDIMPNTDYYEVQMVHTDDSAHQTTYNMGTTTINSITVQRPRAGHFVAMVRGCNTNGCSEWSPSIDPTFAVVDGNPGAWRVFWKLAPPIWE